jgi:hypothetical protein
VAGAAGIATEEGTLVGTTTTTPEEGDGAVAAGTARAGGSIESFERARSIHASPAATAATTSTSHGHTGALLVDLNAERGCVASGEDSAGGA